MRGTVIAIIAIVSTWAALEIAPRIERELAVRALYQKAREENRRTIHVFEPIPVGDGAWINTQAKFPARIRDLPEQMGW